MIEAKTVDAEGAGHRSVLRAKETFSKTFDEVLTVAPPVMSNTREFFRTKLNEALPTLTDDDQRFRTYLIFNWLIDQDGGRATPRQVIAFINELTSVYVLHDGGIQLATVAVYLVVTA
ncbi:hypothetical protein J5289_18135 [Rhizobium sp. B230/85]|uniref:hypothetical protein n=1 Tax=unclassified Rhizobium TaxID=2613769 RepID=UPI001AD9F722|nr:MULTISPECIES: hypothetical protein [unclassified Rhizobium]MBO9136560.1 hypothetical protein [Rhizobium sp. B209b/85]QXZ98528.1 hypothetical protein J5289_18135 [Rhizobium sp. B230/85]